VPVEGVVNALRTLHAALADDGLLVDTQPTSAHPPVAAASGELGTLDMREWARTIAAVDDRFEAAIREGLFAATDERSFVVTESFDDAAEMLAVVRDWRGTHIPAALERRIAGQPGGIRVHQDIRLRLLRAL
jgi:hypothetical protein